MKYLVEFLEHANVSSHESAIGILGDLGQKSKFGEQTDYFTRLVQEAQSMGLDCYVFTDFDKNGTTAWTLNGDEWSQVYRGLPKVFYDRSFRKKAASGGKSNTRALCNLGCTPINSPDFRRLALDKYRTYSALSSAKPGGLSVPRTERFSASGLVPFLENCSSCIVKPRFGSGGRGIIKISKLNDQYEVRHLDGSQIVSQDQLVQAVQSARSEMRSGKRAYVMQDCVDVPSVNGSVFDVRVIYQRDSDGEPRRTGMAVRMSAPTRITSNLHRGGSRLTLSQVLQQVFGQSIDDEIGQSIRSFSKQVFEQLDSEVGPIGEAGLDFLVDRNGQVHLIEVNAIPGRSLFTILPQIREKSIKRPIEYARHLLTKKAA